MSLTQDEVIQIMELLESSRFNELHLEMDGFRLFLSKKGSPSLERVPERSAAVSAHSTGQLPSTSSAPTAIPPIAVASQGVSEDDLSIPEGMLPIKSPILGVFYRAPEPGKRPFVEEGSIVDRGATLCIIEVMKLYSTITAEVSGRIAKVCAQDGQMVEYGQTLFLIEPQTEEGGAQLL